MTSRCSALRKTVGSGLAHASPLWLRGTFTTCHADGEWKRIVPTQPAPLAVVSVFGHLAQPGQHAASPSAVFGARSGRGRVSVDPVDPGQGRCSITSVGVAEVLCASGSISARPLLDTEGCQFR